MELLKEKGYDFYEVLLSYGCSIRPFLVVTYLIDDNYIQAAKMGFPVRLNE